MNGRCLLPMCLGATVALLAAPRHCPSQSINIDLGEGHGGPPATFAGAGPAGFWNVLAGDLADPVALAGLDGGPTAVTIQAFGAAGTFTDIPLAHPEIGPYEPLLGDAVLGPLGPKFPVEFAIGGLADGAYRLITYTWYWPSQQFAMIVDVGGLPPQPVGGPWPGGLVTGVTHMVSIVHVAGGELSFAVSGSGDGSFFNGDVMLQGIQLWKIDEPPPCPADLDDDGTVGVIDFLQLLAAWGVCPVPPGDCPADLDGDGTVGVIDFLALLAAWGPCPGTTPVSCGDPGLGDCYAAAATPGCNDPACCAGVCGSDPYCCAVAWDALCAGVANLSPSCAAAVHPNCGNAEAGPCDQGSLVPGCADPACCQTVCAMDGYCCAYEWDGICAQEGALFCSEIPAGCGHPAAGDCFDAIGIDQNVTPYCDDKACCNAVCAIDPFCCQTLWDTVCVAQANATCEGGACGPGAGDCFTVHLTGGCDDVDCCFNVCALVPVCCEDFDPVTRGGWEVTCVQWAMELCGP